MHLEKLLKRRRILLCKPDMFIHPLKTPDPGELVQEWWWTLYDDPCTTLVEQKVLSFLVHAIQGSKHTWKLAWFSKCHQPCCFFDIWLSQVLGPHHTKEVLRSKHLDRCSSKSKHDIQACALRHPEVVIPLNCSCAMRKHPYSSHALMEIMEPNAANDILVQLKVNIIGPVNFHDAQEQWSPFGAK